MFKKVTIAVLGLAASSIATAGSMGPACTPGNVTIPCEAKLWDFGAQALYLRSVYGTDKAYELGALPVYKEVKNDWNWGFRLEGSYHFNTGNDLVITWMHFNSSIDSTDFLGTLVIPPMGITGVPAPFELSSQNQFDQVNVVMGQRTALGMRDKMRLYAGLQYANIQSTATNLYSVEPLTAATGFNFSLFDNTDYKGFGPVIGIDYAYNITDSLSLIANGSGSILYGTNRYHSGFVLTPIEAIPDQIFFRKKGIVPSLEAKLGLNYAFATPLCLGNIQVGYQAINYFNALEAQPLQNLLGPVLSVDYGLFGPYFGLKFIGNS